MRAHNSDQGHWDVLYNTICNISREHGHESLRVEFIEGCVAPLCPPIDVSYECSADIGSSLGVAGINWASGALGGYLYLHNASNDIVHCSLTCHHVLRPTRPRGDNLINAAVVPYDPELNVEGVYHREITAPDTGLRVEQPALMDHNVVADRLAYAVQRLDERLAWYGQREDVGIQTEIQAKRRIGVCLAHQLPLIPWRPSGLDET